MIPQLLFIALYSIGLGISFAEHGKPKTGNHNAWASLIAAAIVVTLLYLGGFFNQLFK